MVKKRDNYGHINKRRVIVFGLILYILIIFIIFYCDFNSKVTNCKIFYANGSELKYEKATLYINSGNGWNDKEAFYGDISKSGKCNISVNNYDEEILIRIDPAKEQRDALIRRVEVSALGKIIFACDGERLESYIDRTINVGEIGSENGILKVIASDSDPELYMNDEFNQIIMDAMHSDLVLKVILIIFFTCFALAWFFWTKIYAFITKYKKLVMAMCGCFVGIAVFCYLFQEIIWGNYAFSYTNVVYLNKPFNSLKIAAKGLSGSDMADSVFPFLSHLFDGKRLNQWSRYNIFGYAPVYANYILNPLSWMLYGLTAVGQMARFLMKDAIAFVGMYLFLRDLECGKLASCIGGITYIFSSAIVMWSAWPHTDVACMGAMLFFIANRFMKEIKRPGRYSMILILIMAVLICMMFAAGMPVYAMYFLYLGTVYGLYYMIVVQRFTRRQLICSIILLFFAIALGAIMSFAYTGDIFFSTSDYQTYREASKTDYAFCTAPSEYLLSLLIPHLFLSGSGAIEWNTFSGIFFIFLIPAIAITKKDKNKLFWVGAIGILLFVVYSKYAAYIFQYMPFIHSSRKTRIIVLINFCISVVTGLVISDLIKMKIEYKKGILASIAWSMCVVAVIILMFQYQNSMDFGQMMGMVVCCLIALVSVTGLVLTRKKYMFAMVLFIAVSFSGAIYAKNGLQLIDADAPVIPEPTDSIAYLQANAGNEYRMATVGSHNFPPNYNGYYGINNMCAHDLTLRENKLAKYLSKIDSSMYDMMTKISLKQIENWNLLAYGSVRYLLIESTELDKFDLGNRKFELNYFEDGECVIELLENQPRAYVANQVIPCVTQDDQLEKMENSFLKCSVFLKQEDIKQVTATEKSYCSIEYEGSDQIVIRANMDGSGYLVLSDYCDDDWDVYIDGRKSGLLDCNYMFKSVYLEEAGEHNIKLVYHDRQKEIYWLITLIGFAIFFVVIIKRKQIEELVAVAPK